MQSEEGLAVCVHLAHTFHTLCSLRQACPSPACDMHYTHTHLCRLRRLCCFSITRTPTCLPQTEGRVPAAWAWENTARCRKPCINAHGMPCCKRIIIHACRINAPYMLRRATLRCTTYLTGKENARVSNLLSACHFACSILLYQLQPYSSVSHRDLPRCLNICSAPCH